VRRRTATRVKDGRVQKKNNWAPARDDYHALPQAEIRLDRRTPGEGFRHLVTIAQLRRMLDLLPDWDEAAVGLNAIVLDEGGDGMGWHEPGVIAICAWERELWWTDAHPSFVAEHDHLLSALEVERVKRGGRIEVRWSEAQARAVQLLHILPHELGHHRDRMATRSRREAARGEPYAEAYANRVFESLLPAYDREFGGL
jgi:hypothetical protein